MPLTIWRPAQYAAGFAKENGVPANGGPAAPPFHRDTLVREVARFSGWKERNYCAAGEFEATLSDVYPGDIQRGHMVMLDGDLYVIEGFTWAIDENGYTCTVTGRDFWRYPDSEIVPRVAGGKYAGGAAFTGADLLEAVALFFNGEKAGWFRDERRFPYEWAALEGMTNAEAEAFLAQSVGVQSVVEVMSHGAEWRTFANWFNVGVRFGFEFNDETGLFEIRPRIYKGADNGVTFDSRGRGVSDFEYGENGQAAVNSVLAVSKSKRWRLDADAHQYDGDADATAEDMGEQEDGVFNEYSALQPDDAENYAERLLLYSEAYVDAGDVPEESDGSADDVLAWIKSTAAEAFQPVETSCAFSYDNSGAYRYGEHFGLGDWITLVDEYLGVSLHQRLTKVRTEYAEGAAKSYGFEFGSQRITREDMVARMFAQINRRNQTN